VDLGAAMMDRARHQQALEGVERMLATLLDESVGLIGHEATMYRALLWDAKATVKAAAAQLARLPS
jgi:hypothetical protein